MTCLAVFSWMCVIVVLYFGPACVHAGLCDSVSLDWTDICQNTDTVCEGACRTGGTTCFDFCSSAGLTCSGGWAGGTTCDSRGSNKGCDSTYTRQICQCSGSAPTNPAPRPAPNPATGPGGSTGGPEWHKYGGWLRAEGWRQVLADELGDKSKPYTEKQWKEDMNFDKAYHETRLYDLSQQEERASKWVEKRGDGHIRWELRENRGPSVTLWKAFLPQPLNLEGDKVTLKMQWKSEPLDDNAKLPRCPDQYKDRRRRTSGSAPRRRRDWTEENKHLRCIAGTGDFRVGLFNARGKAMTDMDNIYSWPAYQVRFHPHVDRDGKDHVGENDISNASFWWRRIFAHLSCIGLLDDWCQDTKQCGFTKLKHNGKSKFGLGSEAPFDTWFNVDVILQRINGNIKSTLVINGDEYPLDAFVDQYDKLSDKSKEDAIPEETKMMNIDAVDVIAISYNNLRPYRSLEIKDVVLEGRATGGVIGVIGDSSASVLQGETFEKLVKRATRHGERDSPRRFLSASMLEFFSINSTKQRSTQAEL